MTKPVYSRGLIVQQLTTSWGGGDTAPRTWYDDQPNYSQPMGSKLNDTIYYSLNPDWSQYVDAVNYPNYQGHIDMDPVQKAAAQLAFQLWDDLVPFSIAEWDILGPANGQTITFNYSSTVDQNSTETNYNVSMAANGKAIQNAYIWFDTDWATNHDPGMALGAKGFFSNIHEIGHALGLSHPGPYNGSANYDHDAVFAQDNREYTVMSYFGYYDTLLNGGKGGWTQDGTMYAPDGGTGGRYFYPQTPMVYDIAAIQAKYGADPTTRPEDTTYGFHCTIPFNVNTPNEKAIYDFSMNAHPIFTIYDAGGYNTLDCSGYSGPQTIDLTPGHYSSVDGMTENVAIAFNTTIQEAIGGGGDDTFMTGFVSSNYTVDGGAGTNVLDYHWDTLPIKVDVLHGEVFKTGATIKGVAGGVDTFFNVQDFIGGNANDTFLGAGLLVSNTFDGGGGTNNKLDYSALTTNATFDLQAGTVDKGGTKIQLGTDHFADIQSFISGSGNDTIKSIGDSANYFLDGGTGFDTLDYSLNAARVKIDLQNSTVDKGGNPAFPWMSLGSDSFIHFEAFKGSTHDDIFIDGPGSYSINGGTGSDTVELLHGSSTDYSLSTYYDFSTHTMHTMVTPNSAGAVDGPLDLVSVEQLHFLDKTVALNSFTF